MSEPMPKPISPNDFISVEYYGDIWAFITKLRGFSKDALYECKGMYGVEINSLQSLMLYASIDFIDSSDFRPLYYENGIFGTNARTLVYALNTVLASCTDEIYDFIALCINRQDGYLKYDFRRNKAWGDEFPLLNEIF